MNAVYGRKDSEGRTSFWVFFGGGGVGLACGLGWPQTLEFPEVPPSTVFTGAWLQEQKHGSELCRVSDLCILFRIRLMNII